MEKVYHLDLDKDQVQGARIALIPGDPFRVPGICEEISLHYAGQSAELTWNREYRSFLCNIENKHILVTSTGIGGPSTSIAIEELAMLGIETVIRVGTTGAIQDHINTGDVVITTGSVRLDGASRNYAPVEYPAVANHEIVQSLIQGAEKSKVKYHVGITASTDTFYPGEERYDSFTKYVIRDLQGSMEEWRELNVLNYEMESSTVLTLCNVMKLRGGCVTGVVSDRKSEEQITQGGLKSGEYNAIKTAVAALEHIL